MAIVAFVPVFINVLTRAVGPSTPVHGELMQSYAASDTAESRPLRPDPRGVPYF